VTADAATTVVWAAEAPDARAEAALESWARAQGRTLVAPADVVPVRLSVDLAVVDTIENGLDDARDAIAAGSADEADRAIATTARLLHAHPELPNAAWLMAEVERARATRLERIAPADPNGAKQAWANADALDGGRLAGAGEQAHVEAGAATLVPDLRPSPEWQVWIDGTEAPSAAPFASRAGPHAVVVTWREAPVWATWIEIPPGTSTVALSDFAPVPCSTSDFDSVVRSATGISASRTRCARWIAVAPGEVAGTVRVAACGADTCGPAALWPETPAWDRPVPTRHDASRGWPAWATWGLVGTSAAVASGVAAGIVVLATQRSSNESRWVTGALASP
jgi:hypothetical protein